MIQTLFNVFSWASPKDRLAVNPAVSLYEEFGKVYERNNEYLEAEKQFIRSNFVLYSELIVKWSRLVTEEEKDLLIARSVFRYFQLNKLMNIS
jgi:hypothetical protein